MSDVSPADLYLARIAARPPYRWTIYTVFLLTAIAALYFRVVQGRSDQALPWYFAFLALYGFGMAAAARAPRSRVVYLCFGLVVAAAFTRPWIGGWTRLVGVVEAAASLGLLAAFAGLAAGAAPGRRDRREAVLQSGAPLQSANQEDHDEKARSRRDPGRDDGHRLGPGQGL